MNNLVRGDIVRFTANFLDEDGAASIPVSAALYINYITSSGRTTATVAMALQMTDSDWTADWESYVASPGIVYWTAKATGPHAAVDGSFLLTAGPANPNP